MALLRGLKQVKALGIKEVNVIGDSQTIIITIVENSPLADFIFARVVSRIRILMNSLQSVNLFHVMRENNKDADLEANRAVLLAVGALSRDKNDE